MTALTLNNIILEACITNEQAGRLNITVIGPNGYEYPVEHAVIEDIILPDRPPTKVIRLHAGDSFIQRHVIKGSTFETQPQPQSPPVTEAKIDGRQQLSAVEFIRILKQETEKLKKERKEKEIRSLQNSGIYNIPPGK